MLLLMKLLPCAWIIARDRLSARWSPYVEKGHTVRRHRCIEDELVPPSFPLSHWCVERSCRSPWPVHATFRSTVVLTKDDPSRIGGFRLVGRLGSGGMGVVYAGIDKSGRRVAVKVVHPALAGDTEFRARFAREAAVLRRVRGACVAQVIAADTSSRRAWIATEYVSGSTLDAYIREQGALTSDGLYGLAAGLAEALVAIHAAGVVHRDLKPANVILSPQGPRVVDFGIARALDETAMTRTGVVVGSPGWISPEEYRGQEAQTAADVHNWGLLIAFAASGVPPFGSGRPEVLVARVLGDDVDTAAVPAGLRELVDQALSKDPGKRPDALQVLSRTARIWQSSRGEDATLVEDPASNITSRLERTWVLPDVSDADWPRAPKGSLRRASWALGAVAGVALAATAAYAFIPAPPPSTSVITESAEPKSSPTASATPDLTTTTPLAVGALHENQLLAFDAQSGQLIDETTLPVDRAEKFQVDLGNGVLYFSENRYADNPEIEPSSKYSYRMNSEKHLGGFIYRLNPDGTFETVVKTKRGNAVGALAANNGRMAYVWHRGWQSGTWVSEERIYVLDNDGSRRTIEMDLAVGFPLRLSLSQDGTLGVTTHELGAGGSYHALILPPGTRKASQGKIIESSDGYNCQISSLTWANDSWLAVESKSPQSEGCHDDSQVIRIAPDTTKGKIIAILPGKDLEYDLYADAHGRAYATDFENKSYLIDGNDVKAASLPRYTCGSNEISCLSSLTVWSQHG